MSNFLAIATVTAALSEVLSEALAPDVGNVSVTTSRPDGNGSMPATGVNVFLYQVTPNAAWNNADLPTRRSNGELIQRPQAALDLHYLLTFYGDEAELQPQRVLGSVVRTLHARPVLTREIIRQTIARAKFSSFLATSNLADAVELVKFTPLPLSLEDLSKLWSVYFQTPYSLSMAYQGTVVLIESEESTHSALPVRSRNIYVSPFRQPLIEKIRSEDGENALITSTSSLIITGKRLGGDETRIRIGDVDVTPPIKDVSDTQITLKLPAVLRAGVQGLQVVQLVLMGTPPTQHRGVESNLAAFVLHPTINKKVDDSPDITVALPNVTVKLSPKVSRKQRASLLMNELNSPSDRTARAYSFEASPRNTSNDAEETDTLTFPISGVTAGDYLVRVQVDGAGSPLEQAADESNPVYIGPKVTIP